MPILRVGGIGSNDLKDSCAQPHSVGVKEAGSKREARNPRSPAFLSLSPLRGENAYVIVGPHATPEKGIGVF